MGTRNVNLTDTLDHFIDDQVSGGAYQNASEVVRAGLRLLKTQAEEDAARLEALRGAVQVGLDELDRGEGVEVSDAAAWLDGLGRKGAPR